MWKLFRSRRRSVTRERSQSSELKGAPLHARVKTYSAETGFVYQYVYRGYRRMTHGFGMEHVFEARRDRAQQFTVTIHLLEAEVSECVRRIGRELIGAERYALVKMSLFAALDEFGDVVDLERPLVPEASKMAEYLRILGRVEM